MIFKVMKSQEKHPSLTYFLSCYFHQDFEVLFGTADKTIITSMIGIHLTFGCDTYINS